MTNPYAELDDTKFWKKAVAEKPPAQIDPKVSKRFMLTSEDVIATAGSCFAQNVAKFLRKAQSVKVMEAEVLRPEDPVFSGRYGNIYTARQLLQLYDEVQAGAPDQNCAIQRRQDNRWVDVYRPFIEPNGFDTAQDVIDARAEHIKAIKPVFSTPDTFIFTLGLTEGWKNTKTGKVYPICPGVYSDDAEMEYEFHNFTYEEITVDMKTVIEKLLGHKPTMNIMLTVSPVPLTATYAEDDVLTATILSKSILRTVCGTLVNSFKNVFYFPSYEMIANPFTPGSAYDENMRTVRADIIEVAMKRFEAYYIGKVSAIGDDDDDSEVVCDDVEIENSMGF